MIAKKAPSHLTRAQVSRILEKQNIKPATVYGLSKPGGALQTEEWYGSEMIPAWRVRRYLARVANKNGGNHD